MDGLALELNSLGSGDDRARYRSKLVGWLTERREQLDPDSQERLQRNPLRILDSKIPATQAMLAEAPTLIEELSDESRSRFARVTDGLRLLGIPYTLNPRLVRGLDYYSHTAFEITSTQLGAQATVCGGGRYDGLVELLGGPVTPAIGWALGLERLAILLAKAEAAPIEAAQIYVVSRGDRGELLALQVARQLRQVGYTIELDLTGAAFGKQFKRADRSGARWALVIGDDEAREGLVLMRDLRAGQAAGAEERLTVQQLLVHLSLAS